MKIQSRSLLPLRRSGKRPLRFYDVPALITLLFLLLTSLSGIAQTITVQPGTVKHNTNSHIVGTCRNSVKSQSDANANFNSMLSQYGSITPVFGTQRKLYRLGGSNIDGLVCTSWSPGYHFQSWTGQNGPYPYDDINNFISEANSMNADMMVGVNFGSGTASEAASLVQHFKNQNLLSKVKFFELGNEINEPHQKGHSTKACTPPIYANNVLPFVTQMKAVDPNIKLGYCASTNSLWAWSRAGYNNEDCNQFNLNQCGATDYNTNGGIQTLNDILSVVGKDNFDYLIFHSYPSWPIIIPSNELWEPCPGYALTDNQMAMQILAQNEWNITNRITPLYNEINTKKAQGLLKSTFQIANTEYFTHVSEKHRPALVGSITEALYTADNMLTAFKFDFASAINFSFYHEGGATPCTGGSTEFSSNVLFKLNNGQPKPSFTVQKMLAENLGDVVVGDSDTGIPNVPNFVGHASGQTFTYKKLGYLSTKRNSDGALFIVIINRSTDDLTVNLQPNTTGTAMIKSLKGLTYTDQNPTETAFTAVSNLAAVAIPKLSINIVRIVPSCTNNITNAGVIAGAQTSCEAYNPTAMTNTTSPSGGTGTLEMVWQLSTTSATSGFTDIAATNALTYDPPSNISVTTWYRRGARRAGCTTYLYTTAVAKTVSNVTNGGAIAGDQSGCGSYDPTLITNTTTPPGGSGTIVYSWEKSTTSATSGFSVIAGATLSTYDPTTITQTTWYRRGAKTGACTVKYSNVVTKTVTAVCADAGVTITATPTTYTQFSVVTFTVKAKNWGTTTISNLIVRCTVPSSMVLTTPPPSVTGGTFNQYCAGGVICWEWAGINLTPSQEHTLTLPLFQNGTGPQTVTATIFNPTSYSDGVSSNNSASVNISTFTGGSNDRSMDNGAGETMVTIRPNPVQDEMFVEYNAAAEFEYMKVFDLNGKLVREQALSVSSSQTTLNVGDWPSGVYMIHLAGKKQNATVRFVKE